MNIRKFTAPTARQALREIRNELGDEAVILSNRTVDDGVEIIALANDEFTRLTAGNATVQKTGKAARNAPTGAPLLRSASAGDGKQMADCAGESCLAAQPLEDNILVEIKSMHSMLQQQLAALSWTGAQQRDPQCAGLLRRMLNSGFSPLLAHQLTGKIPAGKQQGESWIKKVLKLNLHVAGEADDIVTKGGVYALIGPTGVGKTTTTAKLAARAVVRYGADKVALLTTDSYRIGAYEQLKIYGKILGVAVHAVKDTDDLRLTLSALSHKHLVLIDTVGMGQRDERVNEQSEMFDATGVQRLLLLNATSSGDTLEDVVRMYQKADGREQKNEAAEAMHCGADGVSASEKTGAGQQKENKVIGCIVTKLDEAVNLGAVLDVAVRHRLVMHYMANGQRVPEDLHPVNLDYMLHQAFKPVEEKTAFTLHELDFSVLMAAEGALHGSGVSTGTPLAGAADGMSHGFAKAVTGREASYAF